MEVKLSKHLINFPPCIIHFFIALSHHLIKTQVHGLYDSQVRHLDVSHKDIIFQLTGAYFNSTDEKAEFSSFYN